MCEMGRTINKSGILVYWEMANVSVYDNLHDSDGNLHFHCIHAQICDYHLAYQPRYDSVSVL